MFVLQIWKKLGTDGTVLVSFRYHNTNDIGLSVFGHPMYSAAAEASDGSRSPISHTIPDR